MAHSQEYKETKISYVNYYLAYYNKTIKVGPTARTTYDIVRTGRAASKHNPKVDGFRNPSSYYGFVHHIGRPNPVACTQVHPEGRRFYEQTLYPQEQVFSSSYQPPSRAQLEQILINRALVKLKGRKANLAVTLAEGRQTVRMLGNSVRSLIGVARDIRRSRSLRGLDPRRWRKSVRDLWLEARYGWRPLLYDVFGAAQAFEARLNDARANGYRFHARTRMSRSWETQDYLPEVAVGGSFWNAYLTPFRTVSYKWKGLCRLDVAVGDIDFLRLVDTGVTDPLVVAWELVPYSFVVDWFYNVTQFLEAATAMKGLVYMGGSVSAVFDGKAFTQFTNKRGYYSLSHDGFEESLHRFDRRVITNPTARPVWTGADRLNLAKEIDLIALLHQLLTRPPKRSRVR